MKSICMVVVLVLAGDPYVVVQEDGWKVLNVVDKVTVYVEGRTVDAVDNASAGSAIVGGVRVDFIRPTIVKGRERAAVMLPAKEVRKIKEGDMILGGEKLYRVGQRKIRVSERFSTEAWVYSKKRPKTRR